MQENLIWQNIVYTTAFLVKVFCSAGYLKRRDETPMSIEIWIGLVDVHFDPKYLAVD